MSRRHVLLLSATGVVFALAVMGFQQKPSLLILEWAAKGAKEKPPLALLIELGRKDAKPVSWSGKAVVKGAKVVHREGYRFRKTDKLIEPNAWEASSHEPIRKPPNANPQSLALEPIAGVGIVLHLDDVKPDATLTITAGADREKIVVPVKDLLAGEHKMLWKGTAAVRRISTAMPVVTGPTEDDFPAAAYGPDGTLWVAYISYTVKEENRRIEAPQLKEKPANFKSFFTPEFGDQLFVKSYKAGSWSEPIAITEPKQDLVRCAVAVEGNGDVWVAYSAHRQGSFNVYVRPIGAGSKPGAEQQLTKTAEPNLLPVMCTTHDGGIVLACQTWKADGEATISAFHGSKGKWSPSIGTLGTAPVNWQAAVSADPTGGVGVGYDTYRDGDYDVYVIQQGSTKIAAPSANDRIDAPAVAASSRFEARPSVCYDAAGRLWIAYEEGPENWGKNFGALDDKGNPMYFARTVKVVCLENGKLMKPVAELPTLHKRGESPDTGQRVEAIPRYSSPILGLDGKGRLWITYRQKFGTRYSTNPGSYWLTFARRLDGDKWSEPIELHHSDGLLDSRPAMLPHPDGGLRVIHNTDNRFVKPDIVNNDIYMSYVDLPGEPVEPKLVPHEPGKKEEKLVQQAKNESEAVKRIRSYRVENGGKKYQLLRGEFHRHTEISWDGGPDGTLEDMFRYAIDSAALDWIGNGDHDNGGGREYTWWLTQKLTDAYQVKQRFTPMFTYERSVNYPHGHRNCMFAQRGVRTLPRLAPRVPLEAVANVSPDDTKMLYRYLHELDGICAIHTSATSMGTDWRDNDPKVEPFVEIYQGDRMSYEKQGAPRAGYEAKTGKKPVNIAGWYPLGYINLALAKGYRLAFQSSSDHFSTHISYGVAIAEKHDRAGILDAFKKRHCYAATDDIILDVQCAGHLMGDEFKIAEAPEFKIHAIGTSTIAQIDILKDSDVIATLKPGEKEFKASWTDFKPTSGVHWYYIRVLQSDDEIAWGSPMWIDYTK